jgi:hypothetical protein
MDEALRSAIADEAARIEEDSTFSSKGHFNAEASWKTAHYVIGCIAALSGAIAGGSAFSDFAWLTAIAGAISGIAAAALTFFNPSEKAQEHKVAGDCFGSLRNDARIFRTIALTQVTEAEEATEKLAELNRRRTELNASSSGIPSGAYEKARRHIDDEDRATHRVDKEH